MNLQGLNKFIPFGLIKPQHKKVVFFFGLLISLSINSLIGQIAQKDTLINVSADTLKPAEEGEDLLESPVIYTAKDSAVF